MRALLCLSFLFLSAFATADDMTCRHLFERATESAKVKSASPRTIELGSNFTNEYRSRQKAIAAAYRSSLEQQAARRCGSSSDCMWYQYATYTYGQDPTGTNAKVRRAAVEEDQDPDRDLFAARRALRRFVEKAGDSADALDVLASQDVAVDRLITSEESGKRVTAYIARGRLVAVSTFSTNSGETTLAQVAPEACAFTSVRRVTGKRVTSLVTEKLCKNRERARKILLGRNTKAYAQRDQYFAACLTRGGRVADAVCACKDGRPIDPLKADPNQRCVANDVALERGLEEEAKDIDLALAGSIAELNGAQATKLKTEIYAFCDQYQLGSYAQTATAAPTGSPPETQH